MLRGMPRDSNRGLHHERHGQASWVAMTLILLAFAGGSSARPDSQAATGTTETHSRSTAPSLTAPGYATEDVEDAAGTFRESSACRDVRAVPRGAMPT